MVNSKELSSLPLFSGIPEEALISISGVLKEESFKAGSLVIKEGDPADFFYILRSGEIEVRKTIDREAGKHKTLAILEEGDVFGEMAIFGKELRTADVVTLRDSILWKVDFQDFLNLIDRDHKIGISLLRAMIIMLISRLRATSQELTTLYEVGRIISLTKNIKELTGMVFEQVVRDIPSTEVGFIAIWNRFNEEFDIYQSFNLSEEYTLEPNDPLVLKLRENLSPLLVREFSLMPEFSKRFYEGLSMLVSPLVYNNELIGLIALINRSKQKAFTYSQMVLLSGVCTHLASALKNLEREEEDSLRERLTQQKVYY